MRLILQNIGGALPGEMDRATQGQPGKYTFCCAENEDASPWEPLHVERGFRREQSTVTVVGAEGTMNMNTHSKEAYELARVFADTMVHPPSNEYVHGGEPWLVHRSRARGDFQARRDGQEAVETGAVGKVEDAASARSRRRRSSAPAIRAPSNSASSRRTRC